MTTRDRESRVYPARIELRDDGDEAVVVTGHAALFNVLSVPLGGFRERVARGAFAKTVQESDVRMLVQHDAAAVVARVKAGTLALREDDVGLAFEARLNPLDPDARRLAAKLRDGLIDQMSFGFEVIRDSWDTEEVHDEHSDGDTVVRTLHEVRLWEVSPVTFAAYPATDVALAGVSVPLEVRRRAEELRTAIPPHSTATVDEEWDGPAAVAAMPNEARVLRYCHAWRDAEGDPDEKQTYKFPHHRTLGGPANVRACRNGLARLDGADIPDADRPGVERHLRRHLDDAARAAGMPTDEFIAHLQARERLRLRRFRVELEAKR